jgi:O-antigen ligase
MNEHSTFLKLPAFIVLLGLFLSVFFGVFSVLFAMFAGEKYSMLLALPCLIILVFVFIFARYTLFYLVILFRSVMDPILDATKMGDFGLGAVINALIILIAMIAIIEKPNPVRKVISTTWLPFFLISLVALVIAPDHKAALKSYLTLISYAAVFALAIILVKDEKDYGRWMMAVFLSSLIPVAYGFIDAATGGYISSNGFRINSTFSHPNILAFYLVLMISIAFYFYKTQASYMPSWMRKLLPVYILMMLALLLMTKTRSAWAACIFFFTIYALIYERKYLILIGLALLSSLLVPEIRDRVLDLGQGNEVINYSRLNSYAWRKLIWHDGFNWMLPKHYFFGYGLESFKYYSVDFFTMAGGFNSGAHSVFVQLFFETGAFGLAAFIWLHVKVTRLLIPFYKTNKLMIFSVVMFLLEYALYAYSDNMLGYLTFNWYLWFVLGAAYAVNYAKQQNAIKDGIIVGPLG